MVPRDRVQYYLSLAQEVARRSTCTRANVGAILTNHNRIVGTGYNGGPSGTPHCEEICGCVLDEIGRCALSLHAEINAILSRENGRSPTDELVMYCTHQPCRHCYRIMKQYGVQRIYYSKSYDDKVRDNMYTIWGENPRMIKQQEVTGEIQPGLHRL